MDGLLDTVKTPYEELFPGFSLSQEQIGELNGWGRDFRDMYLDTMVMLEVERRNGVDFLDFQGGLFGFQRRLGQLLEEEVREAQSRNPKFFRRGRKEYFGFLRYSRSGDRGFFLTEEGENYLGTVRLTHDLVREMLVHAASVDECATTLDTWELTQGEYVVQRELFRTAGGLISFGRTPTIFREPCLGGALYGLFAGKKSEIEAFVETSYQEV